MTLWRYFLQIVFMLFQVWEGFVEGQEEEKAAAAGAKSTDAKSSAVSFHGCHQRRLLVILQCALLFIQKLDNIVPAGGILMYCFFVYLGSCD